MTQARGTQARGTEAQGSEARGSEAGRGTVIAHVTDLHFGAETPEVVEALAAELNATPCDLVAISGDLTLGARTREFRAARAFMERLSAPVLAVPGNHDITPYRLVERMTDPYRRWRAEIGALEPDWSDGRVAVVGLNTARRMGPHLDWSRGRVTGWRLRRLMRRFEAFGPGLARVVVAHHPLLPPEEAPQTRVVGGAARALEAFSRAGVRLVLAGHLHRGYARLVSDAPGAALVLQGATATSFRLRGEPNAYNRVRIGPGMDTEVTTRVWDGSRWADRETPIRIIAAGAGMAEDAARRGRRRG